MSAHLSPAQAAARLGVSRWTIGRALKAGELKGMRDNRGGWRIAPDDLEAWAASRLHGVRTSADAPPALPAAHPAEIEVAGLRAEVSGLRERIADLTSDRDAWRAQAERLASQPSWWERLFRGLKS